MPRKQPSRPLSKRIFNTQFARVDTNVARSGLFQTVRNGDDRKMEYKIERGNETIEITSPNRLGSPDLMIFLVLLAFAGDTENELSDAWETEIAHPVWSPRTYASTAKKLQASRHVNGSADEFPLADLTDTANTNAPEPDEYITVHTNVYTILREAGLDSAGGSAYSLAKRALKRLSHVRYDIEYLSGNDSVWETGENLLAARVQRSGGVEITINGRLSSVLLFDKEAGGQQPSYRKIMLSELRQLGEIAGDKEDVARARITLFYLSTMYDKGQRRPVNIDTLAESVYGSPLTSMNMRDTRRCRIRKSLRLINALPSWDVQQRTRKHAGGHTEVDVFVHHRSKKKDLGDAPADLEEYVAI